MQDILARIVAVKQNEVTKGSAQLPLAQLKQQAESAPAVRPFAAALRDSSTLPLIAEVKRRSPSKGVLCEEFNAETIAAAYAAAGAACLSVLTDEEFFGGCAADLQNARAVSGLPVLRKDFMLCEWQIYESRAMGADAVLLIVAVLDDATLLQLAQTAHTLGMAVLVEVHDKQELQRALQLPSYTLLGVNNRNLRTFETTLDTTVALLPIVRQQSPDRLFVSESGIHQRDDVLMLQQAGVDAFLIGEALVKAPQTALAQLFITQ